MNVRRNLSSKLLNPNYIVGLIDGEGSFTVYIKNPAKQLDNGRRVKAEPRFYIKLIEKDKEILYTLKSYFGCGNVYFQKDTRPNHQNCYRYEVTKRDDLEKTIIPFFQHNKLFLKSKQNDFTIFCEIMKKIKKKEHLTSSGLRKLYLLKQQMH